MSEVLDKDDLPLIDENVEGFLLKRVDDQSKSVEIVAHKDANGDFPVIQLHFEDNNGEKMMLALERDELAAVTFALARQDQQARLLSQRFRQYKEVPVKLVVRATRDIKKDDYVIVYRKEKVPLEFEYSYEKPLNIIG